MRIDTQGDAGYFEVVQTEERVLECTEAERFNIFQASS
jgi:hypothetical protein